MATVSERVYSELPKQPPVITEAFQLRKAVPREFCSEYLEENISRKSVVNKSEHILKYSHFIIDPSKPLKKLPRFNSNVKKLTCKEKRKLRIHDVPKTGQKYSDYLQLNTLWQEYMKEVLHHDRSTFDMNHKTTRDILLRADYHGCLIKVVQSKCPTYMGHKGIIMQETRDTFKIINTQNAVKTIPKKSCIFAFQLGKYELKIYGKNFNYRSMDRVNKKFKAQCASLAL